MQTKMFLFVGLTDKIDENILILFQILNRANSDIKFKKKHYLISTIYDDVFYNITLISNNEELDAFVEVANNFELEIDLTPLTKEKLAERYQKIKMSSPGFYNDAHFEIGRLIFNEMSKIKNIKIYSFQ